MPEHNLFRIFVGPKLECYHEGESEKHLRDIAGILAISLDQININILETKIKERLLEQEWHSAKKFKI